MPINGSITARSVTGEGSNAFLANFNKVSSCWVDAFVLNAAATITSRAKP